MFENTVNFDEDRDEMLDHIMNYHVHKALDLPKDVVWGKQRNVVFDILYGDFMKPVVHVGNTRIIFFFYSISISESLIFHS